MTNRTPQTLKKRQREHDKQRQRQEKIARRLERRSKKRAARIERASAAGEPVLADVSGPPPPATSTSGTS
jgi:hypothetical protein